MNPITLTTVAEPLIRQALAEDITNEDVSTASIMPDARPAAVDLIAKAGGVRSPSLTPKRAFNVSPQIETTFAQVKRLRR